MTESRIVRLPRSSARPATLAVRMASRLRRWRTAAAVGATGLAVAGWSAFQWLAPAQMPQRPWSIALVAAQQSEGDPIVYEPAAGEDAEFDFVARPSRRYMRDPQVRPASSSIPTFDRDPTDAELLAGQGEGAGGFGVQARFGQFTVTDDSIAAPESITFAEAMPYSIAGNSMLLGDIRLYRAMNGNLGGTAGLGLRQYLPNWNRVLGVSGFYDLDSTRDIEFQQLSLALELLGENWDLRANGYMPIDTTVDSGNVRVLADSERFEGNRLLFTQLTDVVASTKGVDVTGTVPIRWTKWLEAVDFEASAGFYHFQTPDANTENTWGGRVRFDAGLFGELVHTSVDVTHDNTFDTVLMFAASIDYHGGMQAMRKRGSQKNRFAEWHRRNWTVTAITETVADNGVEAINPEDGEAYNFLHVSDNGINTTVDVDGMLVSYPDFDPTADLGTFENPFESLEDALVAAQLASGTDEDVDVVYTRAGSLFTDADFAGPITLPDGVRVLGEGFVTDGASPREVFHTLPLANNGLVAILPNPTLDLLDDPVLAPPLLEVLDTPFPERPILRGLTSGPYAVTFGNRTEFSGWRIEDSQNSDGVLLASGAINGALADNGVDLGALSQDVSILGGTADGLVVENAVGILNFRNLRIGQVDFDGFNTGGTDPASFGSIITNSVRGDALRISGGTPTLQFFADDSAGLATATSVIAKTDVANAGLGELRDYAVLIEGTANGSLVDLTDVLVVDGNGIADINFDGVLDDLDDISGDGVLGLADVQPGGRGVLVGTDNEATIATTFGTINLGNITTGFGPSGNTPGSGVAISQFGGQASFRAPVSLTRSGAAPSGNNIELDEAALRITDLAPTGTVVSVDGVAPITIIDRNGTGIELQRIAEGSATSAIGDTDVLFLSPVSLQGTNDGVFPDATPEIFATAVNFQDNGGDVNFTSLSIDDDNDIFRQGGAGINIGVRDIDGSPELQNSSSASFTVGTLDLDNIGAQAGGDSVNAVVQILNDPTVVEFNTVTVDGRVGAAFEIFQTTAPLGLGSVTIDDGAIGVFTTTAVSIQQVASSVSFAQLAIVDNILSSVQQTDTTLNPFERGPGDLVIDQFTELPNLSGYVVDDAVVDIRNNTFGGDDGAGAAIDLGNFSVESTFGTALYAINNRSLTIDGGTIDVTLPSAGGAVYVANTFDLDMRFDSFNVDDLLALYGLRVINAGEPGQGAFVAVDPGIDDLGGAGGTISSGGGVADAGIGLYLTDVDGEFLFRSMSVTGYERGLYVENRQVGAPIDFRLVESFPTLAPPTASPTNPLFDTTGSANLVTTGTVTFTEFAGNVQEAIRFRNVQGATLDNLVLEDNNGIDVIGITDAGDDRQVVIEIFNTDDQVASDFFDYIVSNSVFDAPNNFDFIQDIQSGLLDVNVFGSADDSILRIDVFDSEFLIEDDFSSGIDIVTTGAIQPNATTNVGFSGNTFQGGVLGNQSAIRIVQNEDEVIAPNVVAIFNNQVDMGGGDGQRGFILDFEAPVSLRIAGNQTTPGVVGPGGGLVIAGDDAIGVDLTLGGTGNTVLIEDNTFQFDEDIFTFSIVRGINFNEIGGPSSVTIQSNTFDLVNGDLFDGFNDIIVDFNRVNRDATALNSTVSLFSDESNTVNTDDGDFPIFLDFGINPATDFTGQLIFNGTAVP